jgi:hypothetical protein
MNTKDMLRSTLDFNHSVVTGLLADLSDADLLVRPVPGANCIAWQLGHLIASEASMVGKNVPGAAVPELPAGFDNRHNNEASKADPPKGFESKAEYLKLWDKVRAATKAALDKVSDADLDKPVTSDLKRLAPTVAAVFLLAANHELMHSGQFSVVRRKLNRPVLF